MYSHFRCIGSERGTEILDPGSRGVAHIQLSDVGGVGRARGERFCHRKGKDRTL